MSDWSISPPTDPEVLRIRDETAAFHLAVRIDRSPGEAIGRLGPALVLGEAFPNALRPCVRGLLIELRPRLCQLEAHEPGALTVERIVQWALSPHFRAKRVNVHVGEWIGYGYPP